jgi:hypothetical protein
MFTDAEKWRVDFGVEELERTFNFQEREQVFKYYPQYYHKTDKVSPFFLSSGYELKLGWSACIH